MTKTNFDDALEQQMIERLITVGFVLIESRKFNELTHLLSQIEHRSIGKKWRPAYRRVADNLFNITMGGTVWAMEISKELNDFRKFAQYRIEKLGIKNGCAEDIADAVLEKCIRHQFSRGHVAHRGYVLTGIDNYCRILKQKENFIKLNRG